MAINASQVEASATLTIFQKLDKANQYPVGHALPATPTAMLYEMAGI